MTSFSKGNLTVPVAKFNDDNDIVPSGHQFSDQKQAFQGGYLNENAVIELMRVCSAKQDGVQSEKDYHNHQCMNTVPSVANWLTLIVAVFTIVGVGLATVVLLYSIFTNVAKLEVAFTEIRNRLDQHSLTEQVKNLTYVVDSIRSQVFKENSGK